MSAIWDLVIGQDRVKQMLKGAATDPSGSYLFVGPPGTGKEQAAKVFAAASLCGEGGCGVCAVCTRVLAGLHPDVQVTEPEGYTHPVELIRELVSSAAQTPMEAERRVFVIEEADRIVERSQNALLKALEEPNPSVTWVLVADSLDPFLPTILSRCQIIEFAPVAEEAVRDLVESRFALDPEEAGIVVRASRGDVDRAVALASTTYEREVRVLATTCACVLDASATWALTSAGRVAELAKQARARVEEEQTKQMQAYDEAAGTGRGTAAARKRIADRHKRSLRRVETEVYLDFLMWLGSAFRDVAPVAAGAGSETIVASDHAAAIVEASASRPATFWFEMAEACSKARLAILDNANAPTAIESVLLRLAATPSGAS